MDPEVPNTGRPFGGIGFICKQTKNTTYKILDINSDKICALQIITNQTVVATIVGVYMPFYNGKYEQIEVYIDCLDILQEITETYAQNAPLLICGDFNASLPQNAKLSRNWYKIRPYNKHSMLLYDFICSNNLVVSNFEFKQNVNYSYFKGDSKT